jgi:hypothetical protein
MVEDMLPERWWWRSQQRRCGVRAQMPAEVAAAKSTGWRVLSLSLHRM